MYKYFFMDELKNFINANKEKLNICDIEVECNIPKTTINHWLADRRNLPDHYRPSINQYISRLQKNLKKYIDKSLVVSKS